MIRLTWRTLRSGGVRAWATLVALAVGGFLLAFALIVSATAATALNAGLAAGYRGAEVVVTTSSAGGAAGIDRPPVAHEITAEQAAEIAGIEGVSAAGSLSRSTAIVRAGEQIRGITIDSLPTDDAFRWQDLESGSWPVTNSEIALSTRTLDDLGLAVGDRVVFGKKSIGPGTFTITGEIDTRGALDAESGSYGVVDDEIARVLAGVGSTAFTDMRLALDPGADAPAVVAAINEAVPTVWPLTVDEAVTGTGGVFTMVIDLLRNIAVGLIAVSLVVTAIVLATIYSVSLSSRSRLLALQRCVGATRGQVFLSVVAEAVLLALFAGLLGSALAAAAARALVPLAGALLGSVTPATLTVTPSALLLPVAAITAVAAVAALAPALTASRVPPTVALGAAVERPVRPWWSAVRAALAVVLLAGGGLGLATGAADGSPSLIGGGILACGAGLFLFSFTAYALIARVVGAIGGAARCAELSLTGANIRRNPRRSAAVGVSVTVSAVLAMTAWVAIDSASHTLLARIGETPSIDLVVGDVYADDGIDGESLDAIAGIAGVESVLGVAAAHDIEIRGEDPEPLTWKVAVASLSREDFLEHMRVPYDLDAVDDGTLYLQGTRYPPFTAGSEVEVEGPSGAAKLTVAYVDHLDVPAFVTPEVYETLTGDEHVRTVWIGADRGVDQSVLLDRVRAEAVLAGDQPVSGGLPASIRLDAALGIVKVSALTLIAAAMLVALIGLAATTALAVSERRRENAVLRAIGLERDQLRRTILLEGVLLALTGAVLGAALGLVYGLAAAAGLADALALRPVIAIPVLGALGVVLVPAIVLWLTADSVAERASAVPPALALADR